MTRSAFTCAEAELDEWFMTRAGQDERRNVARVFVALDDEGIVGFYTLSMFTLSIADLPEKLARKLPRYEAIPAALIGRLARHVRARGQRIGELLLADAVKRTLAASKSIAAFAIVVDAKNDLAQAFYKSFGFIPFPTRPMRLFLLTETAAAALERSG